MVQARTMATQQQQQQRELESRHTEVLAENEQLRSNVAKQNETLYVLQARMEALSTAAQNQQRQQHQQGHDLAVLVQEQVATQVAAAVAAAVSVQQTQAEALAAEARCARAEALAEKERHDALVKQLMEDAAAAAADANLDTAGLVKDDDSFNEQVGQLSLMMAQTRDELAPAAASDHAADDQDQSEDDGFEMVDDGVQDL
jgi:hypothetical protein